MLDLDLDLWVSGYPEVKVKVAQGPGYPEAKAAQAPRYPQVEAKIVQGPGYPEAKVKVVTGNLPSHSFSSSSTWFGVCLLIETENERKSPQSHLLL